MGHEGMLQEFSCRWSVLWLHPQTLLKEVLCFILEMLRNWRQFPFCYLEKETALEKNGNTLSKPLSSTLDQILKFLATV
jgi:hypothetical protein